MKQPFCNNCPNRYSTKKGCCRGCPNLQPPPAVPAMGEAALIETPPTSKTDLETFLDNHPNPGILRVQAYRGRQVLPVPDLEVTISRQFDGEDKIFYKGTTDQSGIIDPIYLPGAKPSQTLEPETARSTATYKLTGKHPDYAPISTVVDIFSGIKTIQRLSLYLNAEEI